MTDHEALEALSKKATQGTIEVLMPETEHDHGVPLIATDYPGTFGPSNGLVLWATMLPTEITDKDTAQAEANAAFTAALWNAYRTGQLIPAPRVDDAMVERCAIFRQIGRWEMAYEIAFNLETPVKDCTPGAPEQAAFDKAAKLVAASIAAKASRAFSDLPLEVQFGEGEWAKVIEAARQALSDKTQEKNDG